MEITNKVKKKRSERSSIEYDSHVYINGMKIKRIMIPKGIKLEDIRVARLKELLTYKKPSLMNDNELKEWVKTFFLESDYTVRTLKDMMRYSPSPLKTKFVHHDTVVKESHSLFSEAHRFICIDKNCEHGQVLAFSTIEQLIKHCAAKKSFAWKCYMCRNVFYTEFQTRRHLNSISHHNDYNLSETQPLKKRIAQCVSDCMFNDKEHEAKDGLVLLLERL